MNTDRPVTPKELRTHLSKQQDKAVKLLSEARDSDSIAYATTYNRRLGDLIALYTEGYPPQVVYNRGVELLGKDFTGEDQ